MATFTLRKALRLKKQIEGKTKPANGSPMIAIDVDNTRATDGITTFLNAEEAKYLKGIDDSVRISRILSELRDNIDKANTISGVNTLLSKIAHLDRQLLTYKAIADAKVVDHEILKSKIMRKREAVSKGSPSDAMYSYVRNSDADATISACVLSEETINDYKAKIVALRKERESLEDQRLVLNNTHEHAIEIGDDDLAFLSDSGIV